MLHLIITCLKRHKQKKQNLQNADNGAAVVREIMHAGDNVGGVEKALSVGCHQHEEAHDRDGDGWKEAGDGGPHEKIAQEALGRAQEVYDPWSGCGCASKEVVEEAGEDSGVDSDVLEDGDKVER